MKKVSFKFVITIIAFVLLVIFAVQNASTQSIKFLFWHFEMYQAVIIMVSAALGAIIGFTIFMIKYVKHGKASKSDQKALADALSKNKTLEEQVASMQSKAEIETKIETETETETETVIPNETKE